MQKRANTQASTIVILLSILTILIQFAIYYYFNMALIIWVISSLLPIISCHILLGKTGTYRICFDYSFLTIVMSLLIILLTYGSDGAGFLPYSYIMLGIAFINWIIPMFYCFIRYMLDYGSRVEEYNRYYWLSSSIFLMAYSLIMIYGNFWQNAFSWAYPTSSLNMIFSPFEVLFAQIEDYLNGVLPLKDVLSYLGIRILTYAPYGFYLSLALRRRKRLVRFGMLLVIPAVVEILQYFIITERFSFDDFIYALIGEFIGFFLFFITASVFRTISGHDFLSKGSAYGRMSTLHF